MLLFLYALCFVCPPHIAAFTSSRPFVGRKRQAYATSNFLTSSKAPQCQGYSIRDSWNLIVLGDLHMEDGMTTHNQARADCIEALKDLSLIPCPPPRALTSQRTKVIFKDIVRELEDARAGDLSVEQLEMVLARRRDGDLYSCYVVSLGDLGRKDIRHQPGDAGTTKSFEDARAFLDGFNLPYDLVSGNHGACDWEKCKNIFLSLIVVQCLVCYSTRLGRVG